MFVPVVRVAHHYIQTPKNPHILDIFSRVRVSYILFGDILFGDILFGDILFRPRLAHWETYS